MSGCKVADGYGSMLVSPAILIASGTEHPHFPRHCALNVPLFVIHFNTSMAKLNVTLVINEKVTGVGTNTEWGQLMANLSEDNGEETPLQVTL